MKNECVPEAGQRVEYNWRKKGGSPWEFLKNRKATVNYISYGGVVLDDCFFDYADYEVFLKPLKTEAEKRREKAIEMLCCDLLNIEGISLTGSIAMIIGEALVDEKWIKPKPLTNDQVHDWHSKFIIEQQRMANHIEIKNMVEAYIRGES